LVILDLCHKNLKRSAGENYRGDGRILLLMVVDKQRNFLSYFVRRFLGVKNGNAAPWRRCNAHEPRTLEGRRWQPDQPYVTYSSFTYYFQPVVYKLRPAAKRKTNGPNIILKNRVCWLWWRQYDNRRYKCSRRVHYSYIYNITY
jgi:hypothetical protein